MSFAHQSWENRPGPTVGYQVTAYRPHYVGDGSNCRRQAQQQSCFGNMPSLNIAMHSTSDASQKSKDSVALISQAAPVSTEKSVVPWQKTSSCEHLFPSRPNEEPPSIGYGVTKPERAANIAVIKNKVEKKSSLRVHFQVLPQELSEGSSNSQKKRSNESSPPSLFSPSSSSSSSSSIGQVSDYSSCLTHKASEESEVQSALRSPLDQMSNLEDSLPIKRGLSRFYNGKSRSFTSLADVSSVNDLFKPENPYAKKRKWLQRHKVNSRSRLGCPPIYHSKSSCSKVYLHSRDSPNSLFSSESFLDDTWEAPLIPPGVKDWWKDCAPPRSYSLSDLEASECRIPLSPESLHVSSPDQ